MKQEPGEVSGNDRPYGSARPGARSLSLQESFEAIMENFAIDGMADQYGCLIPEDFGVEQATSGPVITYGDVRIRYETPRSTTQCFWDFIALAQHASADVDETHEVSDEAIAAVISFVKRWGFLAYNANVPEFGAPAPSLSTQAAEWLGRAFTVRALIQVLVATEDERLADEDTLWTLHRSHADLTAIHHAELVAQGLNGVDIRLNRERLWKEDYRRLRSEGEGPHLQRRLVTANVHEWIHRPYLKPVWDDRGRRVERIALGATEIIGDHLSSIFSAPDSAVSLCSMCGQPFDLGLQDGRRRPHRDRRRFCGDECRQASRREQNRTSWHKHKAR